MRQDRWWSRDKLKRRLGVVLGVIKVIEVIREIGDPCFIVMLRAKA